MAGRWGGRWSDVNTFLEVDDSTFVVQQCGGSHGLEGRWWTWQPVFLARPHRGSEFITSKYRGQTWKVDLRMRELVGGLSVQKLVPVTLLPLHLQRGEWLALTSRRATPHTHSQTKKNHSMGIQEVPRGNLGCLMRCWHLRIKLLLFWHL